LLFSLLSSSHLTRKKKNQGRDSVKRRKDPHFSTPPHQYPPSKGKEKRSDAILTSTSFLLFGGFEKKGRRDSARRRHGGEKRRKYKHPNPHFSSRSLTSGELQGREKKVRGDEREEEKAPSARGLLPSSNWRALGGRRKDREKFEVELRGKREGKGENRRRGHYIYS